MYGLHHLLISPILPSTVKNMNLVDFTISDLKAVLLSDTFLYTHEQKQVSTTYFQRNEYLFCNISLYLVHDIYTNISKYTVSVKCLGD